MRFTFKNKTVLEDLRQQRHTPDTHVRKMESFYALRLFTFGEVELSFLHRHTPRLAHGQVSDTVLCGVVRVAVISHYIIGVGEWRGRVGGWGILKACIRTFNTAERWRNSDINNISLINKTF